MLRRSTTLSVALLAGALALTGCSSGDPLAEPSASAPDASGEAIVIGSQDYYSNEIIAEIYAQALEAEDIAVDRQYRIGQREVYLPEIEAGSIDLFPEYTGNLLQYWEPDTEARLSDDVYAALQEATPDGLRVLDQSPATDQDSYTVTSEFADEWQLENIEDLAGVDTKLTLGGNSESETRAYGPAGLAETYGIEGVAFTPIEDGGGPLTVKALQDGSIQLAIIYTADPSVAENDLVALNDTKGIFLASHVVPLASDRVDDEAAAIIDRVSAAMSPADLVELNARSVTEELPAAQIATDWLAEQDLGSQTS
ncbi:ABC transporter substrate-binding protein [Leucobacter luti]|uniref:Osmoprotectant transport system substrate-binding protein n=1 Tax=Leucobacter luti TaxID=340320 RepID=A0A4Q7TYL2_9MICO|nr:ABC transporter substrate-binding protein [Leucobacter luti]MBL3698718.1 ABC transporter substrate-binding protein [Leucobacter luti]RZT66093.1 osmoprotectant transport system substrate-binding protein [Leucobacter luti]